MKELDDFFDVLKNSFLLFSNVFCFQALRKNKNLLLTTGFVLQWNSYNLSYKQISEKFHNQNTKNLMNTWSTL